MKELFYPFDSDWIMMNRRKIKKALLLEHDSFVTKRIAVLGGSTTHDIVQVLELFLLNEGIQPIFYESEYGQFYQDGIFGNETLDQFEPDLIFIHTSNRNLDFLGSSCCPFTLCCIVLSVLPLSELTSCLCFHCWISCVVFLPRL